jgi:hypothetical protein
MEDGDLGKVFVYAGLAIACAIAWLFTHRFVPETKDHTVDECVSMVLSAR